MAVGAIDVEPATGGSGLWGRYRRWRNRMVADPAFRSRIEASPFTRWLARRNARRLFSAITGFVHSQLVFTALESGLLQLLADGPQDMDGIGRAVGMDSRATHALLGGAEALGLVLKGRDGRWWLADAGAVIAGDPGIAAMIRHHTMLYRDLADPLALWREPGRETETARFWAYARSGALDNVGEREAAAYSRLMSASLDMVAAAVLSAHDFGAHDSVLDIGGGEGAFLRAVAAVNRTCRLRLFDLPPVAARAIVAFDAAGLGDRAEVHGGAFPDDAPPSGNACVTLIRVVCDHDDDRVLDILTMARRSLRPGGTLVIGEAMAAGGPDAALAAAYFHAYFLAMRSGRCRTPAEIAALCLRAGLSDPRFVLTRSPLIASLIVANTPKV